MNVINHLKRFHPSYQDEAAPALRNPNLLALRLVDPRTSDIYRWLEWIVMEGLPLSFCERPLARHNSKLSRLSVETLKRYLDGVYEFVAERIKEVLPAKFGIVLDGWTSNGRHYVAIFAVFNDPDMPPPTVQRSTDYNDDLECHLRRFVLLAFCPMEDEEDLSAQSLFDLVADTLSRFNQPWERVAFMVGDNCSVNQYIGRRGVPFIGCASHRFALAVRDFVDADVIIKVHVLLKRLSTIKGRAILRRVSELAPVMKNDTRWSSIYAMMSRYVELQPTLAALDHGTVAAFDLQELLPTRSENLRISDLLIDLDNFQSVTAELQRPTLTLSAVRRLFDHTLDRYPQLKVRLLPSAAIVNFYSKTNQRHA